MMTNNKIADYMQYAKDLAQAERELEIEHWTGIFFEIQTGAGKPNIRLHHIDLPRHMLDRWRWVINWRKAKLICQYPRESVQTYYSYYDKRTGLETGFNSLLCCLASTKAQVTKVKRRINQYIECNKQNNLFFDEATDDQLLKARQKLKQKEYNVEKMLEKLQQSVEQHKNKNKINDKRPE